MNISLIRVLKMVFLIYQKHMSLHAFHIGHSTLNSVSSVKTTAKLSLGERKNIFASAVTIAVIGCYSNTSHTDRQRLLAAQDVIPPLPTPTLPQKTKSKTLCHTSAWDILDVIAWCVFSGMLVQQIHSFFTPATHNGSFKWPSWAGLPENPAK